MKILFRYIGWEVVLRALLILGVVTALMLLAKGLEFLKDMAEGEIPGGAVLSLLGLAVPQILGLALPLALFFGLVTTISRLCLDSEMDALGAAGIGLNNLLPLVGVIVASGMVLETGLTLWAQPAGQARLQEAVEMFEEQALTSMLRPGAFNEFPGGRILYFDRRENNGTMKEVFFHDPGGPLPVTVTARRGRLSQGPGGQLEAVFEEGVRFQGATDGGAVQRRMDFERYRVRKSLGQVGDGGLDREALPTRELWRTAWDHEEAVKRRTELYRRLAIPLSLPVLILLSVPLGVEDRRSSSRSYGVLWGAMLVLAYHNALIVLEDWAKRGMVPAHWLLWLAPIPLLALSGYLWYRRVHALPLFPGMLRMGGAR